MGISTNRLRQIQEMRKQLVPLTIGGSTAIVHLTRGKRALIDAAHWSLVCMDLWRVHSGRRGADYAVAGPFPNHRFMHDIICPTNHIVDHKNRNGLDNRSENLRPATSQQNQYNRKESRLKYGFIGVGKDFRCRTRPFNARIKVNGVCQHLGYFATAEEAGRARDEAAKKYHGEFAYLNFPKSNVA